MLNNTSAGLNSTTHSTLWHVFSCHIATLSAKNLPFSHWRSMVIASWTGPHTFIFTLHHEVMCPWGNPAIWSHVNEMVNGRQMLVLSCYGDLL